MKHKIWIGLFLAATIILGVGAANELFYQSRQTTKLQSCTLQFDANSKIQSATSPHMRPRQNKKKEKII